MSVRAAVRYDKQTHTQARAAGAERLFVQPDTGSGQADVKQSTRVGASCRMHTRAGRLESAEPLLILLTC